MKINIFLKIYKTITQIMNKTKKTKTKYVNSINNNWNNDKHWNPHDNYEHHNNSIDSHANYENHEKHEIPHENTNNYANLRNTF